MIKRLSGNMSFVHTKSCDEVSSRNLYSYQVGIYDLEKHFQCSGVFVNFGVILTIGLCLINLKDPSSIVVKLFKEDNPLCGFESTIRRIEFLEEPSSILTGNEIVMLYLGYDQILPKIQKLSISKEPPKNFINCFTSGWNFGSYDVGTANIQHYQDQPISFTFPLISDQHFQSSEESFRSGDESTISNKFEGFDEQEQSHVLPNLFQNENSKEFHLRRTSRIKFTKKIFDRSSVQRRLLLSRTKINETKISDSLSSEILLPVERKDQKLIRTRVIYDPLCKDLGNEDESGRIYFKTGCAKSFFPKDAGLCMVDLGSPVICQSESTNSSIGLVLGLISWKRPCLDLVNLSNFDTSQKYALVSSIEPFGNIKLKQN